MEEVRNAQTKVAQSPPSNLCVCSCQCLEVAQPQYFVHVLASMIRGGIATISTLKVVCVCSCQCLVVEEWEDLLSRHLLTVVTLSWSRHLLTVVTLSWSRHLLTVATLSWATQFWSYSPLDNRLHQN